jgi:maltose alpha-D-glucosyltransferase/alpha-amylase
MTTGTTDPPIAASDPTNTAPDGEVRRISASDSIVTAPGDDGRWYKDAVIYQLHVRAFFDSDGDGIGDFRGLAQKLDYIQDLGATALWLLPFYPSPLRDDGYDIADYRDVHPNYGTLKDFQAFLREAHARGLKVITEIVLNHTSEQHPWFQRARRDPPGSRWRNFYVWSDTPDRYTDARIIFQDFETSNWTWDAVAKQYFWHRFYSQQPDLNWDSPDVRRAMFRTVEYWLRMGVDGLRLDAVPYLYEREGTSCETPPETHDALRHLRPRVDERYSGRMLLAEANQWPEDAVAYFGKGDGDECHMAFNFPLMPRMFMAIEMEDRFPVIDILQQTPAIPTTSQWAVFLRNHDELTLEMVTDEERDYMYRAYARDRQSRVNLGIRRRLSPLLENDSARIRLMNALLFSLPGTPIIYYGDEIGMGDNIYLGDRNGVRTPMQWSGDRNAGFSQAAPQALYLPTIIDPDYHYEKVNVESQLNNTSSLLWWMRRMIALRKRFRVFGRGELLLLHPDNNKVLALIRQDERERILVVANLSRHAQFAELDLAAYEGAVPVELFGGTHFPAIGKEGYRLTMSPHSFFWLSLEAPREEVPGTSAPYRPVTITVAGPSAAAALGARSRPALEAAIKRFIPRRRWFRGKAHTIQKVTIVDLIRVDRETDSLHAALAMIDVDFTDAEPDRYVLPIAVRDANADGHTPPSSAVIAEVATSAGLGIVFDAVHDSEFCSVLIEAVARRRRLGGPYGQVLGLPFEREREALADVGMLDSSVSRGEQTNSSIVYGNRYIMKLFRKIEPGVNPDLELGRFLNNVGYAHVPVVAGALEYRVGRSEVSTLAVLQELVPHESEAWTHTLDVLGRFYENVLGAQRGHRAEFRAPEEQPLALSGIEPPDAVREQIGSYLDSAALLGTRTAEMHIALASNRYDRALMPEPITALYQRSVHQAIRTTARRAFQLLRRSLVHLSPELRAEAQMILECEDVMLQRFHSMLGRRPTGMRIRCHGDFHLGQVLFTGRDFVILDFEGEPARPLSERLIKRSPLRDVAGMLRSFHYATYSALAKQQERGVAEPGSADHTALVQAGAYWYAWVTASYLRAYREAAEHADFLPSDEEYATLLEVYLLDKAAYEISYELNNRPDWLHVPLMGLRDLLVAGGLL